LEFRRGQRPGCVAPCLVCQKMVEYSGFQIDRSEFTSRTFPEGRTLDTATDAGHSWNAVLALAVDYFRADPPELED
jgi:hypothetical protein